ncbi:MAG: hypothetical protein JRG84_10675 [Deltaproteobacteria bacterium]|nr:hypothetical protein [Deltaproteobacteria bacterium]
MTPGWQWLAVLAVFGALLPSCAPKTASLAPRASASAPRDAEQRIVALVHDWFAVLEGGSHESRGLDGFVAEPSFELSLIGASVRNLGELESWRSNLRSTHPELEYRLDTIRVALVGEDLQRARFEFERRAVDDGGVPHLARREHSWLVRDVPGEAPVIVRIDERPLLAFQGTGPQIICY